jgi:hypothetical protein
MLLLPAIFSLPAMAREAEYKWGIGIQGNYPLWGGLSLKYMGFHPVDLLAIGRIFAYREGIDGSLIGAISYSLLESKYTRTYIMIGGGGRYKSEEWDEQHYPSEKHYPFEKPLPDEYVEPVILRRTERSATLGMGIMFGNEIILFSRYGFNFEFGQGIGKVHEKVEYPDPEALKLPELERRDESWFQASFVFGFGFHVYFY